MRAAGVRGVSRRRGFVVTTRRDADKRPAPGLVSRRFARGALNRLWGSRHDLWYTQPTKPAWTGVDLLEHVWNA